MLARAELTERFVLVGAPEPPPEAEPHATKLPSVFCPTNAYKVEKTGEKPVVVGDLPKPP